MPKQKRWLKMDKKIRKRKSVRHLYRDGAKARELKAFKKRYGVQGKRIYGATVGKVRRERAKARSR